MSILSTETWKDIPGYEDAYQASTFGNVRSLTRKITQIGRGGKPFTRTIVGRILRSGRYTSSGHVSVVLYKGSNGSPVHQLVMRTFVGEPKKGEECRHIDGNPANNKLDNLMYGSRTQNILDVFRQGRAWRKLTRADAEAIKVALRAGETGADIARRVGVSQSVISQIKLGRIHNAPLVL